jgi:hypothetical protein
MSFGLPAALIDAEIHQGFASLNPGCSLAARGKNTIGLLYFHHGLLTLSGAHS